MREFLGILAFITVFFVALMTYILALMALFIWIVGNDWFLLPWGIAMLVSTAFFIYATENWYDGH